MGLTKPVVGAVNMMLTGAMQPQEQPMYTTNAICRQNNCINPVFPGFQSLTELEATTWQCQSTKSTQKYMKFCKDAVNYDVALKSPNTSVAVADMVAAQEQEAVTMYVYHLAGMNIEALQHRHPESSDDECVRSVWKMVCNTYFPRAEAGCVEGQATSYLRPCKNVCQSYVAACSVQCCDESVKCTVDQPAVLAQVATASQTGYVDALGPSAQCTGASSRAGPGFAWLVVLFAAFIPTSTMNHCQNKMAPKSSGKLTSRYRGPGLVLAVVLGAVLATSLQGCKAIEHPAGEWESKPNYLVNYQFIPVKAKKTGAWQLPARQGVLNSCQVRDLPADQQCSGNGVCRLWNASSARKQLPLFFCECDRDWADPECRTRRKSQASAFLISLFAGYAGLDRFYLGEYYTGIGKLVTLGGAGLWWVYDIVRIGSAPVYSNDYRLAADLPHWVFVMVTVGFFGALGFFLFNIYGGIHAQQRRRAKMLLRAEDDFFKSRGQSVSINAEDRVGMPTKGSYGVPAPPSGYGSLAHAPDAIRIPSYYNPLSSYSAYASHREDLYRRDEGHTATLDQGLRSFYAGGAQYNCNM